MHTPTKLFLAATLSTTLVGGLVSASPAFAAGNKKKFCQAATLVGQDVTKQSDPSTISEENAAAFEKGYKKLVKLAPTKKLKSAVKTIASFYGRLADGDSYEDVFADDYEDFGRANLTFGQYLVTACISVNIPNVTLPGGGEVSIPGA